MQLQSTFGAFLVAFTMVHGAPMISDAYRNPDPLSVVTQDPSEPIDNLPIMDKHYKPSLDDWSARTAAEMIARDLKKSTPPKGKSNEMAKAKGAEAGRKTVAGLKSMLDDSLEKADERKPTKGCSSGDEKPEEDKEEEKDEDDDEEAEKSGDEESEDAKDDKEKEDKENNKRGLPPRFAPARRAPPKGGKGGPSGKPPGGQQDGGSSLGKDILTQTTSNVISDGIWYGVDQAVAEDQPVKRGPPKSNKGGSPGKQDSAGKPPGGQQDGGSSLGKDILTQTTSNVISDGIWYGVDQAVAGGEAPVKRGPPKSSKGSPSSKGDPSGKPPGGQSDGPSSLGKDILTQTTSNVISDGIWYGVDQAVAGDEAAPVKRSPRGGRFRGAGKDIVSDVVSDGISTGIWYGVDEAVAGDEAAPVKRSPRASRHRSRPGRFSRPGKETIPDVVTSVTTPDPVTYGFDAAVDGEDVVAPPVKRSPRGGRFRGAGKDIVSDVVSDGISTGIWYGVDEAANGNEKRMAIPTEGEAVDGGLQPDTKAPSGMDRRPKCAGKYPLCEDGDRGFHSPLYDIADAGDANPVDGIQKRQKSKHRGPSKSPSRTPPSTGGSTPPSSGGSSAPAGGSSPSSPSKTEPKTEPKADPSPKPDPNTAPAANPGSSTSGGFREDAKDVGKDVIGGATTGIIVGGVEAALQPAQPTETVVVEAPAAEAAAPATEEAAVAAPVPGEAPAAPVRRRAVGFSA